MKYKQLLDDFLSEELDNYSYFTIEYIELDDNDNETEYYTVKISGGNNFQYIRFRLDSKIIEMLLRL